MVNAKEKRNMLDYLVGSFEMAYGNVVPESTTRIDGLETNYIVLDRNSAVILVDRQFKNDSLADARKIFRSNADVAFVFYKDGENFFRSAAQDKRRKTDEKSLKRYNHEEVNRMISFRPEESYVFERGKGRMPLQYYQPASPRLNEAIVSLDFVAVEFDYSHIDSAVQYRPENRESSKIHMWSSETRKDLTGDLILSRNAPFLV